MTAAQPKPRLWVWKIPILYMIVLASAAPLSSVLAQSSPEAASVSQPAIEAIVDQYIRSHPEVIEQALQSLEAKRQEMERQRVKALIGSRQNELLHDPASPVSGNIEGDVTLVEFFDYRCRFCKRVANAVSQLQAEDPKVRVVYKDLPILGDMSELAAKAALSSRVQGMHRQFHEALLGTTEELTREEIFQKASEVGLDVTRLEADMANPDWDIVIDRNRDLARDLGISGTPGFIAGQAVVPGAMDLEGLKALVAQARQ